MIKNTADRLSEIEIALLQLQRSALIDTQTIMQLMIDKGICDVEDIVNTRSRIEHESEDVKRIDNQIKQCGGVVSITPLPDDIANKEELKKQLYTLIQELKNST